MQEFYLSLVEAVSQVQLISVGQYEQIAIGSSPGRHLYLNTLFGGNDELDGGRFDDKLYGYGGDNIFYGGSGNDFIIGGTGNDLMDRESGEDTIVLSGNSSEYSIEYKENIRYRETYNSSSYMSTGSFYFLDGPDGSADLFRNIEWLQFDDRRVTPEQLVNFYRDSYGSYSADRSRNYRILVGGNLYFSEDYIIIAKGDQNHRADRYPEGTTTNVVVDYRYKGTNASERLLGSQGANGQSWAHDFFDAGAGDDFLGGGGGRDVMNGGFGNDELRGGYLEKTSFMAVEAETPSTTTTTESSISSLFSPTTTPITNPPAGSTTAPMPTPSLPLEKKTASPSWVPQPMNYRFVSSTMDSGSLLLAP